MNERSALFIKKKRQSKENEDRVYTRLCVFLSEAPFFNMGRGWGGRMGGWAGGVKGRERVEVVVVVGREGERTESKGKI